ncbi:uncharacterized protein LOC115765975 isoform X2 [Drosophila novamexicana]|uniref:uncharacterized protein LOC115765975 isoform X2 n=1 Tax=Drosophila novamexicana TaxID=47314 RepID=UPI0011E5D023|nr:uncharacterized protein LOC115765975 isoform X2 [Drosophila novamexicana]
MPQKKGNQGPATPDSDVVFKPLPPNIFLYIQLAHIDIPPNIMDPLEIHLDQGGSLIIKCDEHYNTDGIIVQDEFHLKPTYTLVFQQDNLDRINHAADNPLLIKLYMCKTDEPTYYETEEMEVEAEASDLLSMLIDKVDQSTDVTAELSFDETKVEMVLLSVGYLDIIKLFGHHRCMLREELYLYPVPDCPIELRRTVNTEWHLYTLVPIAKELTFTNMAFVTFESIYNLKEEYTLDLDTLTVQLSFRSLLPVDRNEYHVIPWCSFNKFTETTIENQDNHHVFEYFRNSVPDSACTGLKSSMEVQMHKLFEHLMRSDHMDIDFDLIDPILDNALVCNTFHRYILTKNMSDILYTAIAWRRYVIAVDVWNVATIEKKVGRKMVKTTGNQIIFSGILDPAIFCFPGVQTIRFAVELKYLGAKKKLSNTKLTSTTSQSRNTNRPSSQQDAESPTFAIIKICLLVPLGQVYEELKVFRETFISQNRLLYCKGELHHAEPLPLSKIQRDAYTRLDIFMRETIRYIVDRNVHSIEDKRSHFCCALQNLTNILLKVIGCDFNMRVPTSTSIEFANLCAVAYNELEQRAHNLLEKIEAEGLDELVADKQERIDNLIDHMNTIKIMNAVGDKRMANYFYEKERTNTFASLFEFYDLIANMERGEYVAAKAFFKTQKLLSVMHDYLAGWIRIYLDYLATRDDPDPLVSANATECLLNSIMKYAENNDRQLDGWILLYCYYKRFDYAPGHSYARWRLEDHLKKPRASSSTAPYSLWGISLNVYPTFDHQRGYVFYESFKMFVRLGLYEFGQVIFEDVQHECSLAESYMISTQLRIFLNQLDPDFMVTTFSFEGSGAEELLVGLNAQLNGNVEYYRGNMESAAEYYARNLQQCGAATPGRDNLLLSKFRLAYLAFEAGNYQLTIDALQYPSVGKLLSLVSNYLMGKAYYKLNEYSKAMECFVQCTTFGSHVPDIWGYLALINLQMGNNMNALTCWKYARADPTKGIRDETIFDELDMIDIDTVDLYVDYLSPTNSGTSILGEDDDD